VINSLDNTFFIVTILLAAIVIGFSLAIPIIDALYRLKITRRLEADFSALISKRAQKAGTPVMGGLIIITTVLILNLLFNLNSSTIVPLLVFLISAFVGGLDDLLNIFGVARHFRPLARINKLIKVHANPLVRLWYIFTYPWQVYKSFFFMLGSNPGKGTQPHERILLNSIAGFAVFLWVYFSAGWTDPTTLYFPLGIAINLGLLFLPFVILTVLFMSNAVNIADGMDGLAAGMLIPALLAFLLIALLQNNIHTAVLCASALGGTIAYLYFNVPPARVQMGDVGSLAMGTLLAVIALEMKVPFLLLIICFPFVLELMSSLVQAIARRILGRRLLMMAPLHHHFELIGWKEEKVVMRFWLLAIFCAILGLWVYLLY